MKRKTQLENLFTHLHCGGAISHIEAYNQFGIQNLTARISDLRGLGWKFEKSRTRAFVDGRAIPVTKWRLTHTLTPGSFVKIIGDVADKIGYVTAVHVFGNNNIGSLIDVCVGGEHPYRVPLSKIRPFKSHNMHATVRLTTEPFVVEKYTDGHYVLSPVEGEGRLIASENLVIAA